MFETVPQGMGSNYQVSLLSYLKEKNDTLVHLHVARVRERRSGCWVFNVTSIALHILCTLLQCSICSCIKDDLLFRFG